MIAIGVRELKARLSAYLRRAREGETILVTDRGRVVAELGAPGRASASPLIPGRLEELAAKGLATKGSANSVEDYPDLPALISADRCAGLLDEERGAS